MTTMLNVLFYVGLANLAYGVFAVLMCLFNDAYEFLDYRVERVLGDGVAPHTVLGLILVAGTLAASA